MPTKNTIYPTTCAFEIYVMQSIDSGTQITWHKARKILAWYYGYINPGINESWYFNLFRDHGNEKYVADFSNTYAFIDEEGWKTVRRVCENVKVLYTLRDPAKRLWSHIKFHIKFTGKQINFEEWTSKDYSDFLKPISIY